MKVQFRAVGLQLFLLGEIGGCRGSGFGGTGLHDSGFRDMSPGLT